MDLTRELLRAHSKSQATKIADYVSDNPIRFKALVDTFFKGPYRITQRAYWPLNLCVERNPDLVKPHLKRIVNYLHEPGIHDAVKRNTLRFLQFCSIPKALHGKVAALCFQYLESKKEAVAIKVFAMTVLSNIIENEPDLKKELKIILEDQLPYASPGFTVRAHRVLKALDNG
jgi:hypothetical protein